MKNIEVSLIMKTNKILAFFTVVTMAFALTSCVQDDDFSVPQSLGNEENARLEQLLATSTMITIDEAKAMYDNDPNGDGDNSDALPFYVENDIYVKGYVTSSDQTGNFYKEFFIQDEASNPTTGLKVILNQVDTYNQFNKGREVYINLKGLYIGEERTGNNVYTIGGGIETDQYGSTVTQLTQNQIRSNVLRSDITMELEPLVVEFSEITDAHIGLFVQINDVEFADDLNGLRYFDPAQDFDTQRTLQVCAGFDYDVFPLETSSFANFKEYLLPTGNGTLKAVVSKTYNASARVLALNSVDDVEMESSRCNLAETIFQETFDDATDNTTLNTTGWLNFAEAGTELWTEQVYSGNGYAEFEAYGTSEASNIGWLISPGIDMDTHTGEILTFQTEHAYPDAGHDMLKVYVSTDFDGTTGGIGTATWTELDFTASYEADFGTWFNFVNSGEIDLSSYTGTAYIAFVYTGSDTMNQNGRIHVDNIAVYGE